jgi:hypothetical protein
MPRFRAVLEGIDKPATTYIRIPEKLMKTFGGRIRVPVSATIRGVTWRTTICNMGMGPMIGVTAATRKAAGIARNDRIEVTIEEDKSTRTVDVPPDFAKAMSIDERRAFAAMAYSHRKEYVTWIGDAKKPETRQRRIKVACEKLRERLV